MVMIYDEDLDDSVSVNIFNKSGCQSMAQKSVGEGGFSCPNAKPDTESQPYLTISYTSQGFQNNTYSVLDAMNNPRKSISGEMKYILFFTVYSK